MRLLPLTVMLCLAVSNNPFVGVWHSGPDPYRNGRSSPVLLTFSTDIESLTLRRESVTSTGERRASTFRYFFDGKYHPLEYPADAKHKTHTVVYRRIDESTLEFTIDHDNGTMHTTTRHTVAADRRTMTEIWSGVDEKGQPIRLEIVLTKGQE